MRGAWRVVLVKRHAHLEFLLNTVSETESLCSENITIMPALCLILQIYHYAQNDAGIIRQTLRNVHSHA